ncbi:hypothetical protein Pyn_20885 [Prunus yedoensis var. nudiflora]|uniref:Uncharacterized protein n=1 Tax=Prunus yedoensis var. nudiflora TaxID=2094558 RepID=A0A314YA47_PRUYE|nr:hypothetical protein Pyn_20885 [Prunus yedoensis var. nudiflora]
MIYSSTDVVEQSSTKKRSLLEEAESGGGSEVQPETTQGKRRRTSPVEVPGTALIAPQVSIPSSLPYAATAGEESLRGRERQDDNPQAKDECGVDNLAEIKVTVESVSSNAWEFQAVDVPTSEGVAPQSQEVEPEMPVPNPDPEPLVGPVEGMESSRFQSESSGSAFMSKARAKILLEKWLALSLEEKVNEEQSV